MRLTIKQFKFHTTRDTRIQKRTPKIALEDLSSSQVTQEYKMFKYQIKHKFAVAGLVVLERNNNMNGDCPETFYQQRAQEVRIYLKHQAGQSDTTQG